MHHSELRRGGQGRACQSAHWPFQTDYCNTLLVQDILSDTLPKKPDDLALEAQRLVAESNAWARLHSRRRRRTERRREDGGCL